MLSITLHTARRPTRHVVAQHFVTKFSNHLTTKKTTARYNTVKIICNTLRHIHDNKNYPRTLTQTHTYTLTHAHARTQLYTHINTHVYNKPTLTLARTHAHSHTHTHKHTHTHTFYITISCVYLHLKCIINYL